MRRNKWLIWILLILAGCQSGAVVFAPTPVPPDLSPAVYTHPGGAFALRVPPDWAVYEQNTTALATAAFSVPDQADPLLSLAVINLGTEIDSVAFGEFIDLYQTQVRPDVSTYREVEREVMGDGSWRLGGVRALPGAVPTQVNTFIERNGSLLSVIEVNLPQSGISLPLIETIINTFESNPDAPLQPTTLSTLAVAHDVRFDVLNVASWTTAEGVFFITGEVGNFGNTTVGDVPLRASLRAADGESVGEAQDTVMGYAIAPGEFAPFSLRFGGGQPETATTFEVNVGGPDWQPAAGGGAILGRETLEWTDESTLTAEGDLLISGELTNIGAERVGNPRATVTVFDAQRNVVGAAFFDLETERVEPGETVTFEIRMGELGSQPEFYIVNVQGLP